MFVRLTEFIRKLLGGLAWRLVLGCDMEHVKLTYALVKRAEHGGGYGHVEMFLLGRMQLASEK
jgi:hypothetical protein